MKLFFVLLITLSISSFIYAQVGVGAIEQVKLKAGNFSKEDLNLLKASKTVFVYRESDELETLKKAIEEVWNYTPISFIPFSEMKNIDPYKTSIFSIAGVNTNTTFVNGTGSTSLDYDNTHIYLNLWMLQGNTKNKEAIKKSYCRIELHPTYTDYNMVTGSRRKDALTYIYKEGTLKNWKVGFLKNYIKQVNDHLTREEERWLYASDTKNPSIKKIKSKTLYVPDYALVKFNKFTGDESNRLDKEKLFKHYPYKIKVIPADELSQKILEPNSDINYLVYVKSSTDKYIYIINSRSGDVLYSKYKGVSYNLKDDDFKDLAKAIK